VFSRRHFLRIGTTGIVASWFSDVFAARPLLASTTAAQPASFIFSISAVLSSVSAMETSDVEITSITVRYRSNTWNTALMKP
jgi:hypothetical protein